MLTILFVILFITFYILGIYSLAEVYVSKDISINFWAILIIFLPVVNIIIAMKYNKKILNFFSIKKFLEEIQNIK